MEELLELRQYVEQGRYSEALSLIEEMEEMSKEDKINKIRSYAAVLLSHLIKQEAEKRTTRSWNLSIWNAAREIYYTNRRHKAGGAYMSAAELREIIAEAYPAALKRAALEALEGRYEDEELGRMVSREALEQKALELIVAER